MPTRLDKDLIALVQSGDKHAFDLIMQKYHAKVMTLVSRYVQDPVEALDVTQECFIKAYKALDKFRGDSSFYTWLYRIAINTAKNHAIINTKKTIEADVENIDGEQTLTRFEREFFTPERLLIKKELQNQVIDVIHHLPKDLKETILLREMEGLTYEEIAGVMSCPIGTVRSRIYRARESIERLMISAEAPPSEPE